MKKNIIFLLFILLIPYFVYADTCTDKISIKTITLEEKEEGVKVVDNENIDNKNINIDLMMSSVNDYAKYKMILTNDSKEEYELNNNLFDITSEYIEYNISPEDNSNIIKGKSDKTVYLTVKYKKEVPNNKFDTGLFVENKLLNLNLSSGKDIIINPETGISFYILLFLILSFTIGTYFMIKNRKYDKLAILIITATVLIPNYVYAVCKTSFSINSNIQITNNEFVSKPFYNVNLRKYYDHLDYATDEASSNHKILVMEDVEEDLPTTIPSGLTNLIIDLNGHEIFYYNISNGAIPITNDSELILKDSTESGNGSIYMYDSIVNNGTLIIKDELLICSDFLAIENYGITNVENGRISGIDGSAINNYNLLNITGGYTNASSIGVLNTGILNMSDGIINAYRGILNQEDGIVNITENANISGNIDCIVNESTLNIDGGTIDILGYGVSSGVGIVNRGIAKLNNITIESKNSTNSLGIKNDSGKLYFYSGNISLHKTGDTGVFNSSEFYMETGTIDIGTSDYFNINNRGISSSSNGKTVIKNGIIRSNGTGLQINGNSIVTLGSYDGEVSIENPKIEITSASGVAVTMDSGSTLNFYDGIIKSSPNYSNIIMGSNYTLNTPTNYSVFYDTIEDIPVAYLKSN